MPYVFSFAFSTGIIANHQWHYLVKRDTDSFFSAGTVLGIFIIAITALIAVFRSQYLGASNKSENEK